MAVTINIAFGDNPRIMPLKDGTVKPEGIDLNWLDVGSAWIFHRNLYNDEFDASENSISSTLLAMDMRSGGKWDWWGLPIFMSSGGLAWVETMHVNTNSGVNGLGDIKGKKIAAPDYEMTLALWMKIVMKDMHNIDAKDNVWYNGRTRELSRDDALGLVDNPPPGVERHWLTEDQYMDTMLGPGRAGCILHPPPVRSNRRPPAGLHGDNGAVGRHPDRRQSQDTAAVSRPRKSDYGRVSSKIRPLPPAQPPCGNSEAHHG